jgi:hypothetical protein
MNWETNMKNKFAEILKVRPEDVHIITCVRGSVKVEVIVDSVIRIIVIRKKLRLSKKI